MNIEDAIRLIECPKCGSQRKTQLGADLFSCDNCQMQYHLDADAAGVHVRQPPARPLGPGARPTWWPLKALLLAAATLLGLYWLSFC